jgi:hypothetical protein
MIFIYDFGDHAQVIVINPGTGHADHATIATYAETPSGVRGPHELVPHPSRRSEG